MAPASGMAHSASRFAETLAGSCAAALAEAVAGVILHGFLTLDDHVPGRGAAAAAGAGPRRPAGGHPAGGGLADTGAADGALHRDHAGSGLAVERRHPGERDLVVELSMCRAHGRSLLGAAPAELIGEVPDRWLLAVERA